MPSLGSVPRYSTVLRYLEHLRHNTAPKEVKLQRIVQPTNTAEQHHGVHCTVKKKTQPWPPLPTALLQVIGWLAAVCWLSTAFLHPQVSCFLLLVLGMSCTLSEMSRWICLECLGKRIVKIKEELKPISK